MAEPRQFALLVGECAFSRAQRFHLGCELRFGRGQLLIDRGVTGFKREDGRVLLAKLQLHAVDSVGFLAEFGELAGGLVLELVDTDL